MSSCQNLRGPRRRFASRVCSHVLVQMRLRIRARKNLYHFSCRKSISAQYTKKTYDLGRTRYLCCSIPKGGIAIVTSSRYSYETYQLYRALHIPYLVRGSHYKGRVAESPRQVHIRAEHSSNRRIKTRARLVSTYVDPIKLYSWGRLIDGDHAVARMRACKLRVHRAYSWSVPWRKLEHTVP